MNIFASLLQGLGVLSLKKLQKPKQKYISAGFGMLDLLAWFRGLGVCDVCF